MITARELLAAAHKADEQIKELSRAAEELRQARAAFTEVQKKLNRFRQAASAVMNNPVMRPQLTNLSSLLSASRSANYIDTEIESLFTDNQMDEFI
jgi:DNA-binding FadR family transcriptional regulator